MRRTWGGEEVSETPPRFRFGNHLEFSEFQLPRWIVNSLPAADFSSLVCLELDFAGLQAIERELYRGTASPILEDLSTCLQSLLPISSHWMAFFVQGYEEIEEALVTDPSQVAEILGKAVSGKRYSRGIMLTNHPL